MCKRGRISLTVLSLLAILMSVGRADYVNPVVSTTLGKILGKEVNVNNYSVYQFRKIPYAKPPIGNLRFKKPIRTSPWTGTLNGTEFGPSCMQSKFTSVLDRQVLPNLFISEDCLYLNVYVPRSVSKTQNKAVMIWVHGGAFLTGQGMYFDASYLSLTGDVIVVTINYRLGVFGFFSTGDSESPGNYGLWDQKMAFTWVKENIRAFGGNPNLITIFGESAGAFSVGLHSIMPHNNGLFQRVITQSGPVMSYQAYCHNSTQLTQMITNIHRCDHFNDTHNIVDCMRNKSAVDLVNSFYYVERTWSPTFLPPIGPVIDNDFLSDDPYGLLNNISSPSRQLFLSLDYMIGTVSSEGSLILNTVLAKMQSKYQFDLRNGVPTRVLCNNLAPLLAQEVYDSSSLVSMFVCAKYEREHDIKLQGREAINMYTDVFYLSPSIQSLRIHGNSKTSNTFQYYFDQPPLSFIDSTLPDWFQGSPHGSELFYLFGIENLRKLGIQVSVDDIALSQKMMTYWANFAKTGNPNSDGLATWETFGTRNGSFALLSTKVNQTSNLFSEISHFWLNEIPSLPRPSKVPTAFG